MAVKDMSTGWARLAAGVDFVQVFLCRSSFYVSLLGLKIPLALLVRASRARHVLAFIVLAWIPFLVFCHAVLLPGVRTSSYGAVTWHTLTAMWFTLPVLVVGAVIVSHVRQAVPVATFLSALICAACFHRFAIPALQPTWLGTAVLQAMFAFFEDGSIAGWVWCLYHVLRLQNCAAARQRLQECPVNGTAGPKSSVLVVGNAPTVTAGPPLGEEVDKFQVVARFNSYALEPRQYTGSKVSYHFSNGRRLPATDDVMAVLPIFNASLTHAVYVFMPHMEDARATCRNLEGCKGSLCFVDEARLLALRQKIGMHAWQIPSSGMAAIDLFLSGDREVTLHGFNFFQGKQIHYFEESPLQLLTSYLERFVTHNPAQERRWVERLVKDGRATFLAQGLERPARNTGEVEAGSHPVAETVLTEKEAKLGDDGEARRRPPGLVRTLLKDGIPSQFSI